MARSLSRVIKDDDEYPKLRRVIKEVQRNIDFEALRTEALQLHSTRSSANLYGKNRLNPDKIAEASAQDLSWRSRLVGMRARLYINLSVIEKAIEAFNNYVMVGYMQDMKSEGFTTKEQRTSFLNNLLHKYHIYLKEGNVVLETIDFIIKDIDQSGYRVRDLMEAIKIHHEARGKTV